MTTLYKRATPAQARILRAVAGAVKNVMDHHPGRELDEYMARSIAKRACGTITSQWGELLAATRVKGFVPSETAGLLSSQRPANGSPHLRQASRVSAHVVKPKPRGALKTLHRRSPLRLLQRDIGIMAGQARREGNTERLAALAEVLRMISVITGQS